jgi:hypothetical protein
MPKTIKKGKDEYYLSNTYKVGNVTCNVYRPILTDYERHIREEMVKDALASFGRSLYDLGLGHLLEGDEV